jgi:uncharacterized damage-inducible protein DinB
MAQAGYARPRFQNYRIAALPHCQIMKNLLDQYATFNHWANQRITDAVLSLDEHQQQQVLKSSFPNIYATVLHLWDVESGWFQRVHQHTNVLFPSRTFNPSMKEVVNGLLGQSGQWAQYVKDLSEADLHQTIAYKNMAGEPFNQELYLLIHHLFNHQTYHRGQLVTMMREVDAEQLPGTDFITWTRL